MTLTRLSSTRYQCADCGEHFAGPHSFARHRTGKLDFPCLSTADALRAAGLALTVGSWTTHSPRRLLAESTEGAA